MKVFSLLRYTNFCRFSYRLSSHDVSKFYKQFYKPKLFNFKLSNERFTSFRQLTCTHCHMMNEKDETEMLLSDPDSMRFTNRLYGHPGSYHNVLIVQPKWRMKETNETVERKLSEAAALVDTLPNWKIVDKIIVQTSRVNSKLIFGSGNLDKIKSIVQKNISISAVFIGVDIMSSLQNTGLENEFKVPVFDRYQIILQIFHDHAHTREARLQLALAEIPYLRVKLTSYSYTWDASTFSGIHHVGGAGETFMETRRRLLNEREMKIRKALEKVKNQRELLRNAERRVNLPLVAVVGYTNCGKTTLIKSLTNDKKLLPEDKLFATLDVTLHLGRLPSGQKVLFIDTVGFISDVPTSLIQSFRSTLEEITLADLVIHVRDISHPYSEQQKETVLKTLQELNLPQKLLDSIIEIKNKVDLVENVPDNDDSEVLYTSATEGTGLPELLEKIERRIFENTDRAVSLIRVPNGGEEYRWLMKEGTIRDSLVDNRDANYIIVEVILSAAKRAKFKHRYGNMMIKLEDLLK